MHTHAQGLAVAGFMRAGAATDLAARCFARGGSTRELNSAAAHAASPAPSRCRCADAWHTRLVRYYSRFGFRPVRVVTGGTLGDLPHMLVWGGAGTRMDADIAQMLGRWAPVIRASRQRRGAASATAPAGAEQTPLAPL